MRYLFLSVVSVYSIACASTQSKSLIADKNEVKISQAAKEYKRAVANISEEDFKVAEPCAKQALNINSQWDWRRAVVAANSCLRVKDLEKAENIGNELSTREPNGPWGPYFLAAIARERNELDRALWMSELALKRASDIAVTHYLKGQILWNRKEFNPAIASFERSVELDSTLIPAHLFLGRIYYRDQDFSKATHHFSAVLKVNPKNQSALIGVAESLLQDGNSKGALENYKNLAIYYPKDGQYLEHIAEIYEVNGDADMALTTYRTLRDQMIASKIQTNVDKHIDAKIKELEQVRSREKNRSTAVLIDRGSRAK
jgi:tetratricopeptide (TPR) repeat protein